MEKYTDEQIDRFINNEMSQEERTAFCNELDNDTSLREEVMLRMALTEAELTHAEGNARRALQASSDRKKYKVGRVIFAAAMIAGLIFLFGNTYKYTPRDLYTAYYQTPVIERLRGGNTLNEEDVIINKDIIDFFNQKEYEKVLSLYIGKWRHKSIPDLPVVTLLYVSISFLETDRAPEAISTLLQIASDEYEDEINHLLLYGYLKENKRDKAEGIIEKLLLNPGAYTKEAKEIEAKLKERRWF